MLVRLETLVEPVEVQDLLAGSPANNVEIWIEIVDRVLGLYLQ